ncbi:hypothetical protein ANN_23444 [Periplaneta americana]|uniref:Dolichyl-diphosphooligosaccharide--protein glycosyltransferase subunit KCP2 n=1 Tax=Periplaneta americana TaxID=6978 RepID=A0ABQ8SLJ5_PERAM|nr:hypothetical protein ANN_23444 [Periplaneta americana]
MIFSVSAVSSGTSFVLSSVLTVLLFSGMQMYRQWLASSQLHTILGGYLGSVLFILVLTVSLKFLSNRYASPLVHSLTNIQAVGNLESTLFGKGFQTKLFPEKKYKYQYGDSYISNFFYGFISVFSCLIVALTASGMVHRVCTTTCFLFSMVGLYYVNRISQQTHAAPVPPQPVPTKKKK